MNGVSNRDRPSDVDPEIARAEEEIARARESVAESLVALERQVARTFNWREWIRSSPYVAVAGAFAVGALLGSRFGVGRRKRR